MNLARLSIKNLLGMADRAEIDAHKTYLKMADRVKNPLLQEKFRILAFEEKKHRAVIEKMYAVLYHGERPIIPASVDEALLPAVQIKPSSSFADILYQAMRAEESAQHFYLGIAKRMRGDKKKILGYLSKVEKSHFMMLKSEYTLALQFEDYAERDIDKVVT
jgi:rubrerythrin